MTDDEYTPMLLPFSDSDYEALVAMVVTYALSLDNEKFKLFLESL